MRMILTGALALAMGVPGLLAQPKPKSAAEVDALKALFAAKTPDERIAAAENVLTKFADSEFKGVALLYEAASYEQKGDWQNAIIFGERAVEADPKNYQAMIMVAQQLAQHTKEFDLDRDEKLAKVDKYAKAAMEAVKEAAKPNSQITDEQWAQAKKDVMAQAHAAMGMGAMDRKKYDVAEAEFKAALESSDKPDPATMVRLGMAYAGDGKYDEAIAQYDKAMATPDAVPQVKQFAQAQRVIALQKKGGKMPEATAPAHPAAPGTQAAPGTPAAPANPTPPATPPQKP